MKVAKWGNSLAVRLPSSVVEALNLKENDEIQLSLEGEREMSVRKAPDGRELLERLKRLRGRLPAGFKFDRLEANER